nr:hypothetical protein CFP56_28624 [Quercus suber]
MTGPTPQVTKTVRLCTILQLFHPSADTLLQTTSFVTRTASGAVTTTVTISTGSVSTSYFVEGTNTITVQSHSTTATHVAVATVYAACNDANQLRGVNGLGLCDAFRLQDRSPTPAPAASAYDCCVRGLQGHFAGAIFATDPSGASADTNCQLVPNRAAPGAYAFNGTVNHFQILPNSAHNTVFSIGNCGNFVYGGAFGSG